MTLREPTGEEFARVIHALAVAPPIVQTLPGHVGFVLLAQLQLALRHPDVAQTAYATRITRQLAHDLEAALVARCPDVADLCAMGWRAEHDRTSREGT